MQLLETVASLSRKDPTVNTAANLFKMIAYNNKDYKNNASLKKVFRPPGKKPWGC